MLSVEILTFLALLLDLGLLCEEQWQMQYDYVALSTTGF